jgi:hypothetical protein
MEANTLNNNGAVYDDLGDKQTSPQILQSVPSLSRQVGYKKQEAITLNNIGRVYDDLGNKHKPSNTTISHYP